MAQQQAFWSGVLFPGTNFYQLAPSLPDAALFSPAAGWIVGKAAPTRYARLDSQTERAVSALTTTVQPNGGPDDALGDAFVWPEALTGDLSATSWSWGQRVRAFNSASGQDGRLRYRVWATTEPATLAGLRELTSSTLVSDTVVNLTTSVTLLSTTWNAPAITLNGEWLMFQVAWEHLGAGTTNGADVNLHEGGDAGAGITTADFTPGGGAQEPTPQTLVGMVGF